MGTFLEPDDLSNFADIPDGKANDMIDDAEALAEEIHELTFDFDAELAIARELAAEEMTRTEIASAVRTQIRAEQAAARAVEEGASDD